MINICIGDYNLEGEQSLLKMEKNLGQRLFFTKYMSCMLIGEGMLNE